MDWTLLAAKGNQKEDAHWKFCGRAEGSQKKEIGSTSDGEEREGV